jgi:hypothetical protein
MSNKASDDEVLELSETRMRTLVDAVRAHIDDREKWSSLTLSNILAKHLSPKTPERVSVVRSTLTVESDRGCALLGVAYIDEALGELLRANFVDDKAANELLDESRALGTLSARIIACHCLGLISPGFVRNLHLLRKIRNDFAHEVEVSFETPAIAARCRELLVDPIRPNQTPRRRFTTNIMMMMGIIHSTTRSSNRPEASRELEMKELEPIVHAAMHVHEQVMNRLDQELGAELEFYRRAGGR